MVEQPAVARTCAWHGCGKHLRGRQQRFCSPNCKGKFYVALRRKTLKRLAIQYKGGKCCRCGYNKCSEALTFHHCDGNKAFGIGAKGYTRSWDTVKAELKKCLLLCANCHIEVHAEQHELQR